MENRLYESVKHPFTDPEIQGLGEALARENQNLIDLREQKAIQMAASNASIKASLKAAAELATKINNRYEMVEVEVIWMLDEPRPGRKTLVRVHDNEPVRYEDMTPAERQGTLGFNLGMEDDQK